MSKIKKNMQFKSQGEDSRVSHGAPVDLLLFNVPIGWASGLAEGASETRAIGQLSI